MNCSFQQIQRVSNVDAAIEYTHARLYCYDELNHETEKLIRFGDGVFSLSTARQLRYSQQQQRKL